MIRIFSILPEIGKIITNLGKKKKIKIKSMFNNYRLYIIEMH